MTDLQYQEADMNHPNPMSRSSPPFAFSSIVAIFCLLFSLPAGALADPDVHLLYYDGPITPVASEFILSGIESATDRNGGVLILQLDTPGGLDTDMRQIVKAILGSRIPVVVFVGPGGSRAASAGAFITLSAHVAAMAPGTNIGSASPVQMMGTGMDSTMTHKVTNDAAAYIASIADQKSRNPDLARSFVEKANNITAEEALAEGVIEILTPSIETLISELDGRTVVVGGEEVTLATVDGTLVHHTMSVRLRFLKRLVDPNIAYLLFLLGVYGLFFELSNPGSLVPGILGGISILLALYAFHALPVDYTGVGLILLGIVLLIMEVKVPSFGALTVGGVISLVLGSMMLFNSPEQWARVSLKVMVPALLVFVGFIALCVALVVRGHRRQPVTGLEAMIGEKGRVILSIGGADAPGKAYIHGEIWDVVADEPILRDARIMVLEIKNQVARVSEFREPENNRSVEVGG
jgi:membrane-bound serine protease (ClpP class)